MLLLTASLEQCCSSFYNNDFCNNDDFIGDISNTEVDNVYVKPYNNMRNIHFNSTVDDGGVGHADILINDENKSQYNILINNRDSRPIPLIPCSRRRIVVDPPINLASVLP